MKDGNTAVPRLAVIVPVLLIMTSWPLNSFGADVYGSGHLIQATPYDRKLATTGVFDSQAYPNESVPLQSSSPENLFWTAKSFRYVPDSNGDYWQTPQETEARHAGDCEDKAVWLYAQLK